MRVAFLVLAHEHPRHLRRLVGALDSPDMEIFLHLDSRSPTSAFAETLAHPRVHPVEPRLALSWGGFSIVEATLRALAAARRFGDFDYYWLISGVDYPLRSNRYILEHLSKAQGAQFISATPMPIPGKDKGLDRLTVLHLEPVTTSPRIPRWVIGTLNRLNRLILPERDFRRALGDLTPHAGSQWWIITREAAAHVRATVDAKPELVQFFRHAWVPDEMFFQTIIANSPFGTDLRPNLTFDDWSLGLRHPAVIGHRHLDQWERRGGPMASDQGRLCEALLARKFTDACASVVDRIDATFRAD